MRKHFYSNIVDFEWVSQELDGLLLTPDERNELKEIALLHLHHTILDTILSQLSERDKKIFLANVKYDTNEKIWRHLNSKIEKAEEKILEAAEDLKAQLKQDLKDAKSGK